MVKKPPYGILEDKKLKTSIERIIKSKRGYIIKFPRKGEHVICHLSGGIDSSLTYLTLKEAKINTIPVFIDHGLMRIIRGIEEREYIKKLFPDLVVLDIREDFLLRF